MNRCELSALAANVVTDAVTKLLDGGTMCVYGGQRPASPDESDSPNERLLVIPLGDHAFMAAEEGVAHARTTWESAPAAATGTATWFRLFTRNGLAVFDGAVGDDEQADLPINDVNIKAGTMVLVQSFAYTAAYRLQGGR